MSHFQPRRKFGFAPVCFLSLPINRPEISVPDARIKLIAK